MRASILATLLLGGALVSPSGAIAAPATAPDPMPDSPAAAAEPDQRDEIVVNGERVRRAGGTGTKTETPSIATPQTITSIDDAELRRRNALSINQALTYVAGVSPNQRGNVATRYDQLYIRGFSPAVFSDGMRLLAGPYSGPQIDFHLVDQVDVVKGPASVLYGNATPGGLVNLVSKLPEREAGGRIELAAGNFAVLRSAIDLNQPLDADQRWLFRVIGGAERSDGFIARTGNRRYYVRPMLRFAPDAATSITLMLTYQRDPEAASYSGVPVYGSALANPFGRLPVDLNVSEPGYEAFDRKQRSATLLFRHDFNDALSLSTSARYLDVDLRYRQIYLSAFATTGTGAARATDFARIVRGGGGADEAFRTITLDQHLTGRFATGPVAHTLLGGLDWQSNRGTNAQQFNTGAAGGITDFNLFAPVYGVGLPDFALTATRSLRKIDQLGLYVQDQMAIGRLRLIASGRWDWYDQLTRNRNLPAGNANAVTSLHQTAFTGRLGALYESAIGLSPFVSYAESFEPQTGTGFDGTPFVPVSGRQYEGGVKYQPRGTGALFTLSAFDLRRRNVPVADPARPNFSIQVGEVAVRGIELDGRGEIRPGLSVTVAGTYTHARVTRGTPPVGAGGQLAGVTGTPPLGVPEWSASSFVAYDLDKAAGSGAGPLAGFNLGAGVRYVGASDGTAQTVAAGQSVTTRFRSPGFVLVDALIGYDIGRLDPRLAGLSLTGNINNLFDTRHIASCFFNNSCYFGASRSWVASLRYAW